MPSSPQDEIKGSAVPQTAHQHHYCDVAQGLCLTTPGASQRYENIVYQPFIQGDVPAFPELSDVTGKLRPVEIFRDFYSE